MGLNMLFQKMARVMGKLGNIPKEGTNDFFKYKFVTAGAVAEAVRGLLAEEGIAFFSSIVGRELVEVQKAKTNSKTGETTVERGMRWAVDFEFTFACAESGETQVCRWTAEADANDDKGINKCATAAEKYFLLKTFIVSTDDEPDADKDGGQLRPTPAAKQSAKKMPNSASNELTEPIAPAHDASAEPLWADVFGITWCDKKDGTGTFYRLTGAAADDSEVQIVAFDKTALDLMGFDLVGIKAKNQMYKGYEVKIPYRIEEKDGKRFASMDATRVKADKNFEAV